MSIETGISAHLLDDTTISGLVGTRVFPLRLKQEYSLPAISYQRISAVRTHDISVGPIGWAWARFQLDCYAEGYSGVRELAEAVRQSMDGYKGNMGDTAVGGVHIEGERDLFEEDAEIYRVSLDFLVPYKET